MTTLQKQAAIHWWNVSGVASLSMTQITMRLTHDQLQDFGQNEEWEKKKTYPLKHIVHSLLTIIVTWSSMASVSSYLHKIKYLKTVQALWKTAADIKTIRVLEMLPLSLFVLTFTAKVNNSHPPLILTLNIKNICIIKIKWHMSE